MGRYGRSLSPETAGLPLFVICRMAEPLLSVRPVEMDIQARLDCLGGDAGGQIPVRYAGF